MNRALFAPVIFLISLSASGENVTKPQSLSIQMDDPPELLDWGGQVRLNEASYIVNLMEGLFRLVKDGVEPAVASRMEVSKDQKRYIFFLNPKSKWSDAKPVYARDFVYAWLRVLSPQSTSLYFSYLYDIDKAEEYHLGKATADDVGIKAEGDFKLVVTLKRPVKHWEKITAFWPTFPMRKDQVEKYGAKFTRPGILISNGPYTFESVDNQNVVLKRNSKYPESSKLIPEVKFVLNVPIEARCKAYHDGQFQILLFPFGCAQNAIRVPLKKIDLLVANVTKFPANEKRFRDAVFASVDMKAVLSKVPGVSATQSLYAPELLMGKAPETKFDPAWARKELKDSGIQITPKTKITILTYQLEPHETIAKRIKEQIEKNLGLNVELLSLANREYLFYSGLNDYHFMLMAWTAKVLNQQDFLQPFGNLGKNRLNYQSPTFDLLVHDGLYAQAEKKLLIEDAVVKPAFFEQLDVLVHPSIKGLYFDHMGLPYFRLATLK